MTVGLRRENPVSGVSPGRWGAASGYVVIVLGVAGAAFERGSPAANASLEEIVAFFTTYRRELLLQSLMFVLSAGAYIWFFGHLRSFLQRAEGGPATLSTIAFGAGIVSVGIQMLFQALQVAIATASSSRIEPALAGLFVGTLWALSVTAYVPLAIMFAAVAVVSLRYRAFPLWIGWLTCVAAIAHLIMTAGLVVASGPLVPGGLLTYVLYALLLVWLAAVTTIMFVRAE
jgi:hypothetical protein